MALAARLPAPRRPPPPPRDPPRRPPRRRPSPPRPATADRRRAKAPPRGPAPAPARLELPRRQGRSASIRVDVDRLDEIAALAGDVLVEGARAMRRSRDLDRPLRPLEPALRPGGGAGRAAPPRRRRRQERLEQLEGDVHLLRSDTFRFVRHHTEAVQGARTQFTPAGRAGRLGPAHPALRGAGRLPARRPRHGARAGQGGRLHGARAARPASTRPSCSRSTTRWSTWSATRWTTAWRRPEARAAAGKPRGRPAHHLRPRRRRPAGAGGARTTAAASTRSRCAPRRCARGLIGEAQAAALSARAALDLIFAPGFSTREQAGETCGRGVGLDVVRKQGHGAGRLGDGGVGAGPAAPASPCACPSRSRS